MCVLAADTAAAPGSLALFENDQVLEEVAVHAPDGFSSVLFPELEQILGRAGWPLQSIDLYAVASGPGSFTGLRVGLAAMKALAASIRRPIAAISNLKALASLGTAHLRAPVIDARRGEVYAAIYDDQLQIVVPESVCSFRNWVQQIPPEVEFVSFDIDPIREWLPPGCSIRSGPRPLASAIASIAAREGGTDPALIDANYVRRSDAELFWRD